MAPIDDYSSSWQDFAGSIKPDVDVEKKTRGFKDIRRYGGRFLADYDANAAYNTAKTIDKSEPHVRNFTTQMRAYSPELNEFFDDFAIDIIKPESITWDDSGEKIRYETKYLCRGSMDSDSFEYNVRKVSITAKKLDDGLLEFTMSNIYLTRVVLELRMPAPQPEAAGFFGKLKSKLKK
ncbi:MAG: hypothetical protein Q4A83_01120 [Bacillota bacterium]|nr:hypothetical protein [Bacillota bacterium]